MLEDHRIKRNMEAKIQRTVGAVAVGIWMAAHAML